MFVRAIRVGKTFSRGPVPDMVSTASGDYYFNSELSQSTCSLSLSLFATFGNPGVVVTVSHITIILLGKHPILFIDLFISFSRMRSALRDGTAKA